MAVIDKKKQKTRKSKIKQSTAISLLFQPVVAVCCCCLRWEKNQQNLEREKGFVLSACSEFCCCCCCCYFVYRIFTQLQNKKPKKKRGQNANYIIRHRSCCWPRCADSVYFSVAFIFLFPLLITKNKKQDKKSANDVQKNFTVQK